MKKLIFTFWGSFLLFSCEDDLKDICEVITDDNERGKNFAGYLYTSANATAGNAIIALGRKRDGNN